nr:transmembrane protein, putative [Ipomoea batatas]GMD78074.1 transmembrane protein, putative [Ipomoea batatas]
MVFKQRVSVFTLLALLLFILISSMAVCRASEGENNEAREWKPWMNHGSFRGPRKHLINPSSQHPFQVPQSAL